MPHSSKGPTKNCPVGRGASSNARTWCVVYSTPSLPAYSTSCSEQQALIAWRDVQDIYRLYLADREASGGGEDWEGLGRSLPCVVFRTLYKAKRYEEALPYLEDALASSK